MLTRNPNYKINLCIIESGLYGGLDTQGHPGMWMGVGGLSDNWGLAHEFCHALQGVTGGFRGSGRENYVGWFWECHANWMPHQLYPNNPHCTEMYTRMANLYWGSHRCRYCNWQFLEYLKEKEGIQFINDIWNNAKNDVIETMMANGGWDIYEFGDLFADFAAKMSSGITIMALHTVPRTAISLPRISGGVTHIFRNSIQTKTVTLSPLNSHHRDMDTTM